MSASTTSAASTKRSLFSSTQTAQIKQKIDHELEQSRSLYTRGLYAEALIAATDFIDCAQSLPGETEMLNVMEAKLMAARIKVRQLDFESGYELLSECMTHAMNKFGDISIAVVQTLLGQAEYCLFQAIYGQTDTILIKALSILGKIRDTGDRSVKFKTVCGETVYLLCELYIILGMFDRVFVLVKEFEQLLDTSLGEGHPNFYFQLIIKGKVLKYQGKYDLARQAFENVISLVQTSVAPKHPVIVNSLIELGEIALLNSNFTEALQHAESAIATNLFFYPQQMEHISFAPSKILKGRVLLALGRCVESLDLQRSSMQSFRQLLGDKHPQVADALIGVADVLTMMGKVTAAAKVLRQATLIYDQMIKRNESIAKLRGYALLQLSLGSNAIELGLYKESLNSHNTAFNSFTALAKILRIENDVFIAKSILGLADSLRLLSQFKKAKGLLGKAGVMIVKLFGEQNALVADCLYSLASLSSDMGRSEEANIFYSRCHAIRRKELPMNHPALIPLYRSHAENFSRVGYFEEGLEPLRVCHALSTKMFGKRSLAVAKILCVRAKVISDLGHSSDADVMFQASLVMLQEVLGNEKNGVYLEVLVRTAEGLRLQGRVLEAEGALRQALLLSKDLYDQQKHVIVAECLTSLAVILLEERKPLEAQALLTENVQPIYNELCGEDSSQAVYVRGLLGLCKNNEPATDGSGTVTVKDAIVHLISVNQVSKDHAYVKILRHGDPSASEAADVELSTKFGEARENKFAIHAIVLPSDSEIKLAENITEQILNVTFMATSLEVTSSPQAAASMNPPSPGNISVISDITTNIPLPESSKSSSPPLTNTLAVTSNNEAKVVQSVKPAVVDEPAPSEPRSSARAPNSEPQQSSEPAPAASANTTKSNGPTLASILATAIPDAPGSLPNVRDAERANARAKGAGTPSQPVTEFSNRLPKLGRRNGPSSCPEDMSKSIPNLGGGSAKFNNGSQSPKHKASATQRFVTNSLDGEFPLATTITGGTITKSGPPLTAIQAVENALNERSDPIISSDMNIADMMNVSQSAPVDSGPAPGAGMTAPLLFSPAPSTSSTPATRYPNLRDGISTLKAKSSLKGGPNLSHLTPTIQGSASASSVLFSKTLPAGDPNVLSSEDIMRTMLV